MAPPIIAPINNVGANMPPGVPETKDKLVVKKGVPDNASLSQLGKKLGVDSFLVLDVFRTRFSLVTEVNLIQASDGQILGTKEIRVPGRRVAPGCEWPKGCATVQR